MSPMSYKSYSKDSRDYPRSVYENLFFDGASAQQDFGDIRRPEWLAGSGADVEVVTERSGLVDLQNFKFDYDLYLFKSHSPLAESLAAAAHYRGAKLLNEYPATMKVRDKY